MILDVLTERDGSGLLGALEAHMGNTTQQGLLRLPDTFGNGYIRTFDLGPIRIMIHQYVLIEAVTVRKAAGSTGSGEVIFSFRNVLQNPGQVKASLFPSVQVSSADVMLEITTPAQTPINTIIIAVQTDLLASLLNEQQDNPLLQGIMSGKQSYLFDQLISPEIQQVAKQLIESEATEPLADFYIRLKAEEIIYRFLTELVKRQTIGSYPLNSADVKTMYALRDRLIGQLNSPPDLDEFARQANMSESKTNRLFNQIFGTSLYNYYQTLRMNEAAYLLREERLSVSETGYRLGFTNLSHFARLFEKHIGMKPKKYSAVQVG